jgi:predicted transcriptional regulator YdeE
MKTTIEQPLRIMGISIITTNQDGKAIMEIGNLWKKFYQEEIPLKIPDRIGEEVYSVYTDYEGDHEKPYKVLIGCQVTAETPTVQSLDAVLIPVGQYEKFTAKGNLTQGAVGKTWYNIWNSNLNRAFKADFEVYGEKSVDTTDGEVDIFVGILE